MHITFSPIRSDETLTLSKAGDVLTINGDEFDFGPLPEGADLPSDAVSSEWITGTVSREGGNIRLTVLLPHGAKTPEETKFPQPITATDGEIEVPAHSLSETEAEDAE